MGFSVSRGIDRAVRVITGLADAAERVPALIARMELALTAAEALLGQAGEVTVMVEQVTVKADVVRSEAEMVTGLAGGIAARAAALMDASEPLLQAVVSLPAALPGDVATLIRRGLPLIDELASLMPVLREMEAAIPAVRNILTVVERLEPVMTDVETRIAGLPGASRMRKRGEREIEEASAEPE